jgi:hypothetical protein
VDLLSALDFHSWKDRYATALGSLDDGTGVTKGIVVGDGNDVKPQFLGSAYDEWRDHLYLSTRREDGMDVEIDLEV